jgi:hypothetical protein
MDETNMYGCFVEKPVEKQPFGRSSKRWKDNTKMDVN